MKYVSIDDPSACPYGMLYRLSLLATAAVKAEFARAGISAVKPAYLGVLMRLWYAERTDGTVSRLGHEDGIRISELGRMTGLEPSSMTGLVDRMERDGLVLRAPDPHDRRSQVVSLTEAGSAAQSGVIAALDRALEMVFQGMPQSELAAGKKFLERAIANLEA